jgi:hypothetical protein
MKRSELMEKEERRWTVDVMEVAFSVEKEKVKKRRKEREGLLKKKGTTHAGKWEPHNTIMIER